MAVHTQNIPSTTQHTNRITVSASGVTSQKTRDIVTAVFLQAGNLKLFNC